MGILYIGFRAEGSGFKLPYCGYTGKSRFAVLQYLTLRVQVPNNHILTQNLYYIYYYPNPKYLNIGYMDPLG